MRPLVHDSSARAAIASSKHRSWAGCLAVAALAAFVPACQPKPEPAKAPAPDPAEVEARIEAEIAEALANVDPALRYERVPLPGAENAFVFWREAAGKLVRFPGGQEYKALIRVLEEDTPFPKGAEAERLTEWLEANEEVLELFDTGIARGRCQFPEIDGLEFDGSYLAPLRAASRLKLVKAKKLATGGDLASASREVAGIMRLGELMAGGEGVLIHYLVALAVRRNGAKGCRWLARQGGVTEAALTRLIGTLGDAFGGEARLGEELTAAIRVEFACFAVPAVRRLDETLAIFLGSDFPNLPELFGRPAEHEKIKQETIDKMIPLLGAPPLCDHADTLRLIGRLYSDVIANARRRWAERDEGRQRYWERFRDAGKDDFTRIMAALAKAVEEGDAALEEELVGLSGRTKNPLGRFTAGLLVSGVCGTRDRGFRYLADREITRAFVALSLYELREGELPPGLGTLVEAGILAEVPADPYDPHEGQPLRYDRAARRIWSVGEDSADDGGHTGGHYALGSCSCCKDIVLELTPRPRK